MDADIVDQAGEETAGRRVLAGSDAPTATATGQRTLCISSHFDVSSSAGTESDLHVILDATAESARLTSNNICATIGLVPRESAVYLVRWAIALRLGR